MVRMVFGGSLLFSLIILVGCGTSSPTVATIGDEKLTLSEFEDFYARNSGGMDTSGNSSMTERQKLLDLIIRFKLKVKDARAQGLEKDPAILNEIDSNRVLIAKDYLIAKEIVEPGVKQMYDQKKEEIHAEQILFRTKGDTVKAYERAMNAIKQLAIQPFDTLIQHLSGDPTVQANNSFFTSDKFLPEFEDACYSLKPGEYTKKPIRTKYGYHIIKVISRQPNPGVIRLSHILLHFNRTSTDTTTVRDTVWMLYRQLKHGADFKELVRKYSQDPRSAPIGGDIGFYELDQIPQNITDAVSKLAIDSISEPVRLNYGYHIFKVTEKKPLPTYAEMEKELKDQYQKIRYQYDYDNYARRLRAKYQLTIDSTVVFRLAHSLDSTKTPATRGWSDTLTSEILKIKLIAATGRPFTVKNFVEKVSSSDDYNHYVLTLSNLWVIMNKLADIVVIEEEAHHAVDRYPDLVSLLREYEDGILLYRIDQDEVWKKITVNDSVLRNHYEANKEKYRWPQRVNFAEIFVLSDSVAKAAYWRLQFGEDFSNVAEEYTVRPGYREKRGEWGFQEFTLNELTRKASTIAIDSITRPFRYENGWSIIKALGQDSAHVKTFEEATPEVANSYQEAAMKQREQEWVETLKQKYPVSISNEVLSTAFKRK